MSLTSRFPERPIYLTITLPLDDFRLIVACLRRALDADPEILSWLHRAQALRVIEAIYAILPGGIRQRRDS